MINDTGISKLLESPGHMSNSKLFAGTISADYLTEVLVGNSLLRPSPLPLSQSTLVRT